jgi:hypothetical protein
MTASSLSTRADCIDRISRQCWDTSQTRGARRLTHTLRWPRNHPPAQADFALRREYLPVPRVCESRNRPLYLYKCISWTLFAVQVPPTDVFCLCPCQPLEFERYCRQKHHATSCVDESRRTRLDLLRNFRKCALLYFYASRGDELLLAEPDKNDSTVSGRPSME